jgi:hypothetical protein
VRVFLRILGFACIAFALVGIATEIDDAREGRSKDQAVGVVMIFIFAGAGALLVRAGYRKNQPPVGHNLDINFDPKPAPPKPAPKAAPDDDFK